MLFGMPLKEKKRIRVVELDGEKRIYDDAGHVVQTMHWNPREDRWDIYDHHGNSEGYLRRGAGGDDILYDLNGFKTGSFRETGVREKVFLDAKGKEVARYEIDRKNEIYRSDADGKAQTKTSVAAPPVQTGSTAKLFPGVEVTPADKKGCLIALAVAAAVWLLFGWIPGFLG